MLRNEEEFNQLQTKYSEARRELANTENALQEAQGQVSTLTFKEQSLQQEVEFFKKDNERLIAELDAKAIDFSTYRKEKVSQSPARVNNSLPKSLNCNLNLRRSLPMQVLTPNKFAV